MLEQSEQLDNELSLPQLKAIFDILDKSKVDRIEYSESTLLIITDYGEIIFTKVTTMTLRIISFNYRTVKVTVHK